MRCEKIPVRIIKIKKGDRAYMEKYIVACPKEGQDIDAKACDTCRLCRISEADFVKCEYNLPNREERLKQ